MIDPAATSFLVFRDNTHCERIPHYWSRVEVGDVAALDGCFQTTMAIIPLPKEHECFKQDLSTSYDTDRRLAAYVGSTPQLRIRAAVGGLVVSHHLAMRDELFAKIHRFES